MPFLSDRFNQLAANPKLAARLPDGLAHELGKFYYDTAQASLAGAMAALTAIVDPSQIVFGTDYPFRTAAEHVAGLHQCGFNAGTLRAIECDNAQRLLPTLGERSAR